jgi:hypothetical protein
VQFHRSLYGSQSPDGPPRVAHLTDIIVVLEK